MSEPGENLEEAARPRQLIAMVLPRLGCLPSTPSLSGDPVARPTVQQVALEWQKLGRHAEWAEMHGASNGADQDRMHELMGRAAVAGEQLGLAWTLDQELQRWYLNGIDDDAGRSMATRALAEMCGYYILAAAHGPGNLTLRTLMLSKSAASVLTSAYPDARGFPPFSERQQAWPSLGKTMADRAQQAAATSAGTAPTRMSQVLEELLAAPQWKALVQRRSIDYHRWRPQGLPNGGVPRRSLWNTSVTGTRSLSGGGGFYERVDHEALCRTAGDALDVLGNAMEAWLKVWPVALCELGVPVFKIDPPSESAS